jgi:hypothetical protein
MSRRPLLLPESSFISYEQESSEESGNAACLRWSDSPRRVLVADLHRPAGVIAIDRTDPADDPYRRGGRQSFAGTEAF